MIGKIIPACSNHYKFNWGFIALRQCHTSFPNNNIPAIT